MQHILLHPVGVGYVGVRNDRGQYCQDNTGSDDDKSNYTRSVATEITEERIGPFALANKIIPYFAWLFHHHANVALHLRDILGSRYE